jgi:hypothetical protein
VSGPAKDGERAARRTAAVILEALAGQRSASEAAAVLEIALPRYYVLERRAVSGMIAALAPRPRGRPRSDQEELVRLRTELERLRGEVARLESLQRLSQRAIGLPGDGAASRTKPPRRRTKARAKRVLRRLRAEEDSAPAGRARAESSAGASDG